MALYKHNHSRSLFLLTLCPYSFKSCFKDLTLLLSFPANIPILSKITSFCLLVVFLIFIHACTCILLSVSMCVCLYTCRSRARGWYMKEAMMSGKGVIISKLLIQLIHHEIMDLFSLLYQFPRAAITNWYTHDVLKQQKYIFSKFWRPKAQNHGVSKAPKAPRESYLASSSVWCLLAILDTSVPKTHLSSLFFLLDKASSFICFLFLCLL